MTDNANNLTVFNTERNITDSILDYLRITVISDEGEGVLERPAPGSREISGSNPVHRIYQGSGKPAGFSGHFTVQTDDDFEVVEYVPGESVLVRFLTKGTHIVKAASSFKSIDGARANLQAEIPGHGVLMVRLRRNRPLDN